MPEEQQSTAKGITITEKNRNFLAERFGIEPWDIEQELPLGHILVTDFGVDEHFDTVYPKEKFDEIFDVLYPIENGFEAIARKDGTGGL